MFKIFIGRCATLIYWPDILAVRELPVGKETTLCVHCTGFPEVAGGGRMSARPCRVLLACAAMGAALLLSAACLRPVPVTESPTETPQPPTAPPSITQEPTPNVLSPFAAVEALEHVVRYIYETSLPSITHIRVVQQVEAPDSSFPFSLGSPEDQFRRGEGSGFVWDEEGHIVTNYHVVADADEVIVFMSDGAELKASVVGFDADSDLAVLRLEELPEQIVPLRIADSDSVAIGQFVLAIGSPFGQEFTITSGIVSALGRTINSGNSAFSIPRVIQTDAAVNPGNSGGPLLDRTGRAIGINTQIATLSGSSSGIGFAIPINTAKQVVPALIEQGRFDHAWLGIAGQSVSAQVIDLMGLPDETRGVLIADVADDSPAARAGLQGSSETRTVQGLTYALGGDIITAIDGAPVEGLEDLITHLNHSTRPGDRITLDILRDGNQSLSIEVELGARPQLRLRRTNIA